MPTIPIELDAAPPAGETARPPAQGGSELGTIEDELLVEEISIDGMCGVY